MRDRHIPRLCSACGSPMARQESSCWQCGAAWTLADRPPDEATARWQDEGGHFEQERDERRSVPAPA